MPDKRESAETDEQIAQLWEQFWRSRRDLQFSSARDNALAFAKYVLEAAPPTEPCESAKRIGGIIHDEMKARLAKDGLKHKGDDKTEEFVAEMVQLAINDSGPARMLKELWEPNLCGHQKMFLYTTTGTPILTCALCRIAELEEAARPTEAQTSELRETLRKALDLVWEHHELGFIRRAYEKFSGSCELCKDSRLLELGKVLEKYDKWAGAQTAESTPPTEEAERNAAWEFAKKNLPALTTDSSDRPGLFLMGWMARAGAAHTPGETCPTCHSENQAVRNRVKLVPNNCNFITKPCTAECGDPWNSPAPAPQTPLQDVIEGVVDEFADWLYSVRSERVYSSERDKLCTMMFDALSQKFISPAPAPQSGKEPK